MDDPSDVVETAGREAVDEDRGVCLAILLIRHQAHVDGLIAVG